MLQAADSLWPLCPLHTLSADHCRESVLHCNICAGTVWLSVDVVTPHWQMEMKEEKKEEKKATEKEKKKMEKEKWDGNRNGEEEVVG